MPIRKFVFKDEKSHKFWNVSWEDDEPCEYTVHYGKVGSDGVEKEVECENGIEDIEKVIKSKVKKGYQPDLPAPVEAAFDHSVEDIARNLNAQFKIGYIIKNTNTSETFNYKNEKGLVHFDYQDGGGNGWEVLIKDGKGLIKSLDHELAFFTSSCEIAEYIFRGAPQELIVSINDSDDITHGMWTNDNGTWLENVIEEDYFGDDDDILTDDYADAFLYFNKQDDYQSFYRYNEEAVNIAYQDKAITKEEVIKIMELMEVKTDENLARVDQIVADLSSMY